MVVSALLCRWWLVWSLAIGVIDDGYDGYDGYEAGLILLFSTLLCSVHKGLLSCRYDLVFLRESIFEIRKPCALDTKVRCDLHSKGW